MFGGFTQVGFELCNDKIYNNYFDSNSFVFSIDKMKIYDVCDINANIICDYYRLPEFNKQIFFEINNIKYGFTGKKKMGYLVDEDYVLNDGEVKFYIDTIQLIKLYTI